MAELLLNNGANINVVSKKGHTALHHAASNGQLPSVGK